MLLLLPALSQAQGSVVISQVYGGGGSSNAAASYKRDFVEIFNRSAATVNIGGYYLQYGSAAGNFTTGNTSSAIPANTMLSPGQYFFIALGSPGTGGATLPTADFDPTTTLNLGGTSGKVVLVTGGTPFNAVTTPTGVRVSDLVGYGPTTVGSETTPTPVLSISTSAQRGSNGCTDADNNSTDFTVATTLPPRTTATTLAPCSGTPTPAEINVQQGATSYASGSTYSGFANTTTGSTTTRTFTIQNTGGTELDVSDIALSGTNASDFSLTALDPASPIAASSSATFDITFEPGAVGTRTATLTITNDDDDEDSYVIDLSAVGQAATPDPEINVQVAGVDYLDAGTAYAFGSTSVGTPVTATFTVQNTSATDILSVSAQGVTGSTGAGFSLGGTAVAPYTVAPNSSTTFTVTFNPTTAGAKTGTITITSDDQDEDVYTIDLTGTGVVNPSIAVDQGGTGVANGGTYTGFPSTLVGNGSSRSFTITNSGPDALAIASITASGTEFVTSGTIPTTVAANGGTATFTVVFQPSAAGTRTGSVTINNNSPGNPAYVLNFSAAATEPVIVPFTPGNLVVSRVGTGSAALAGTATPVFLEEFATTAGQTSSVQTIALPTADQGSNQTLTTSGTSTSVGAISRSIDGQYLVLGGYDAAVGTTVPGSSATLRRTVARVGIDAGVSVTTAVTNAFSGGDFRSVATTSGTNLWLAGSVEGIRHTTNGSTTSTVVASSPSNNRVVQVFDTKVYYSTGSGTTARGIWMANGDFPTASGSGSTQIVATGNSSDPYGFVMLDASSFTEGLDVLYVIDGGGQLLKYYKSGVSPAFTWVAGGSATIPAGARGVTGSVNSGIATLYFNTPSTLYSTTDVVTTNLSGAAATTILATAAANTAFRGVAFAPELLDLVATGNLDRPQIIVDGGTYRDIFADQGRSIRSVGPLSASGSVTITGTNATLDTGCTPLTGTASFAIQNDASGDGGTLVICDPAGLSLSGATGQIQVTGTRNYGTNGNFQFTNGSNAAQVTGPGFPSSVNQIYTGSTGGVTLTGPVAVNQLVQLSFGSLNLNGQTLTLRSTNSGFPTGTGQQARVIQFGANAVIGTTAIVQRAITNATPVGYRHYSSPVAGETIGTLATAGFTPELNQAYNGATDPGSVTPFPNVYGYDETRLVSSPATTFADPFDKGWFVPTAATPMTPGRGFTVNISRNAVVDFAGQLNNGPIARSGLTRTAAAGGWHLLGNPYPEDISFQSATQDADPTNPTANLAGMDAAIYVFEATSQYGGNYRSFVNGVGDPEVSLGQGFFARTSALNTSGTVRFGNNLRGGGGTQFRQRTETRPLLRLHVADAAGTLADKATVYFEAVATNGFDSQADAVKLNNPSGLSLATVLANGEALSIDGRPALGNQAQIIPLTLAVPRAGTYTFSVGSLLNLSGATVYLRDALTGSSTLLSATSTYRVTLAGTSAVGRFSLAFQPAAAPLATAAQALAAQVQVYPNPASGSFQLALPLTAAKGGVATLTNGLGQTVLTRTLTGAETTFDVRSLAAGVYNLHLTVNGTKVVRRVVVE